MILKLRHILEFIAAKALYLFFSILPIGAASYIGGKIGRGIGRFLSVNKVAQSNLKLAMPQIDTKERQKTILDVWENLGRIVGEFPHMTKRKGKSFDAIAEVEGAEIIEEIGKSGKAAIFFSGHISNWEIVPKTIFEKGCPSVNLVYRRSNNPYIDKLILDVRSHYQAGCMPKGSVGARYLIKAIKNGEQIGMLVDQKQNDGIAVPFFGHDAMTAPAIGNMALKFDCPIVPIQVIRTKGANFKVKVYPPLKIEKTGDTKKDTLTIMTNINTILEDWIRANPSQWFWVHNRWPKR